MTPSNTYSFEGRVRQSVGAFNCSEEDGVTEIAILVDEEIGDFLSLGRVGASSLGDSLHPAFASQRDSHDE
jgi:hypothetical protein